MANTKEKKGLNINVKSFLVSILILFVLMIFTYILTLLLPGEIPFWKWALSPVLVLGAEGNVSLIAVILFLLIIGGIFNSLEKGGLMKYMLDKITASFGAQRYRLLALVTLFFMAMGACIGSFEEVVPLVPIVVALAIRLGWNALVGMGMSLLAIGSGFASGICNPFTVGVAQELAGLPMFSGIWFRMLCFLLIYGLLMTFLYVYAKRIEKPLEHLQQDTDFVKQKGMDRGLLCFVILVGIGVAAVLCSAVLPVLQDYTMIIVAVSFLVAGIAATLISGMKMRDLGRTFGNGLISVLPAVLMILMANSIKYILVEADLLELILLHVIEATELLPRWTVILFIYLIVLVMNFFVASGSAKAFLMIPLIIPVAQAFDISAQLCIVAFAFGDGFSNVFYPTNPVLLISLGLADVNYVTWAKWSGRFQILNLILTSMLLLFGLMIGYC